MPGHRTQSGSPTPGFPHDLGFTDAVLVRDLRLTVIRDVAAMT
jgi:hypothetical protein